MNALHPHLQAKKHIIWDWNGTLLRDVEHAVQTTNRLLAEEKLPPTTIEHYKKIFRFPVIDYYRDLGFDTSEKGFKALCERFNHYFHEGLSRCDLWPGVRETLGHVAKNGQLQSVLSASEQNLLNLQVKHFALESYFAHVLGLSDKAAGSKVERGHTLMKKAGISPHQTIMIGDTDHDLEVAKALGIDIILADHGHQCADRLREIHPLVMKIF